MKKLKLSLMLSISLLFNSSLLHAGGDESGSDCENATFLISDQITPLNFQVQQEILYVEFTAAYSNLFFEFNDLIGNGINLAQLTLYEKEDCNSLNMVYNWDIDTLAVNQAILRNLTTEGFYLLEIRRGMTEEYNSAHFSVFMQQYVIQTPCPISYDMSCGELVTNKGFQAVESNPVHPTYPFFQNEVCEWEEGVATPQISGFNSIDNNLYAHLWSRNDNNLPGEALVKNISLSSVKTYIVSLDLKKTTVSNPAPEFFRLNLLEDVTYQNNIGGVAGHALILNSLGQNVVNIVNSEITDEWKTFTSCFSPNTNTDWITIFPRETRAGFTSINSNINVDNVSIKEFVLDAGPNVSTNTCGFVKIGPDCLIPGATYSWTPTNELSNPNIPNPIAFPQSQQTYTLTVSIPGSSCTINDDVVVTPSGSSISFDYIIPDGADMSWIVNNVTSTPDSWRFHFLNFYVEGVLNLDDKIFDPVSSTFKDVEFHTCHFTMGENSKIIVSDSKPWFHVNNVFETCESNYFWDGIYVKGELNGSMLFDGNLFKNSFNGIVSSGDIEKIRIQGCDFDLNNLSVQFKESLYTSDVEVDRNEFKCSTPISPVGVSPYYPQYAIIVILPIYYTTD